MTDNPTLTAALDYATRGWPVFPCYSVTTGGRCECGKDCGKNAGKHPRTANGFYDATTDPDQIRAWWSRWPTANVAIRTGGGLVVVDADSEDALTELVERDPAATITAMARTSRGYHLLFEHYGPVKCYTKVLPDLDVKADGGYILAAPSRHASGTVYAWEVAPHEVSKLTPFPAWLSELIETETPPPAPVDAPKANGHGPLPPTVDPGAAALFTRKLDELATAPEGIRNETLNAVAYTVGGLVGAGRLDHATAERGITAAARATGLPAPEIVKHTARGLTEGATRPLDSRPRPLQVLRPGELIEEAPPPPWDATEPPPVVDAPPVRQPRFRLYTAAEWKEQPDPEWLCDGLFVKDTLAALIGAWRSFKTFFALDLALSTAAGLPFHGRVLTPGPVVYVSAEGAKGLKRRIRAWEIARKVSVDAAPFYVLPDTVHLLSTQDVDDLRAVIMSLPTPPVLAVIDTLARCLLPGDENSSRDMGQAVEAGDVIRRATGATVLFLHHPAKNGDKARGPGALPGGIDTELTLTRENDVVTVKCTKQKDGAECEPFALRPTIIQLTDADEDTSLVLDLTDLPRGGPTQTQAKMLDVLRTLAPDGSPVLSNTWRDACESAGISPGTFRNNTAPMVAAKLIGASGQTTNRQFQLLTNHGVSSCE